MKKTTWINITAMAVLLLLSQSSHRAFAQGKEVQPGDSDLDAELVKASVKRPQRIDKTPFVELLAKAKKMMDKGGLDTNGSIEMKVTADRNPTGSLYNIKIEQKQENPKIKELANDLILLISKSRVLDFLEGAYPLEMMLRVDHTTTMIEASTEVDSEKRAAQLARVYNLLFDAGSVAKRGRYEEVLYQSARASANGKIIRVKLSAPREAVVTLLSKQLETP